MHDHTGEPWPVLLPTVSAGLIQELLSSIERISKPQDYARYLERSGIGRLSRHDQQARITHDQLVRLYQVSAVGTGDEMMGLWSRPIRQGALKTICQVVIDAPSVQRALYRFCRFWNLVLDDYALTLVQGGGGFSVEMRPREPAGDRLNRFGHLLMLKLVHGIASWLVGRELPVRRVAFAFPRPGFAGDYPILLPAPIEFDAGRTAIGFDDAVGALHVDRHPGDVTSFLERAPRDWIFTAYQTHSLELKVREFLRNGDQLDGTLAEAASHLHVSARTLLRRLSREGQSFQSIKDGLRRDIAIRELSHTRKGLDQIAFELGFSSQAVFHRAFKHWTGRTPGRYRPRAEKSDGRGERPKEADPPGPMARPTDTTPR